MVDQMPRSIAKIEDFSGRAAENLINILGKQRPTADMIADLVGRATRAYDSDQMAKAAALQESMRALGYNPDKIRGALAGAGFRDGIVGSKELQDRYEKANQAQIAKTQLDNTLRVQGLQEQGSALAADFVNHILTMGPENAYMWMQDHQKQLNANPYAYDKVMSYAKSNNIGLTPYTSPSTPNTVLLQDASAVEAQMNNLKKLKAQALARGINTSLSPEEAIKTKDFDAWLAEQAKLLGYGSSGSGYSNFQENMREAWNELRGAVPNASPEAVLHAMKQFMDSGGMFWRWGGIDQENVDIDKAKDWLIKDSATWQNLYNDAFKASKAHAELEKAYLNNTIQNVLAGVATQKKHYDDLVKLGRLSVQRRDEALNQTISKANTANSAIVQALLEAAQLQKKYPSFNIK